MSQSASIRTSAYRFVFPPPAYCAYTGGALPDVRPDPRPGTEYHGYPKLAPVPVNLPPPSVVHVADVIPRKVVHVSPYPIPQYVVLPGGKMLYK